MWKIYFRRLGFVLVSRGYQPHTVATETWSFWVRSFWSRHLQIRFPPETCRGRKTSLPLSASGGAGCPLACGRIPPLFTCVLPVSLHQVLQLCMSELCVQVPLLIGQQSCWIRPHPDDLISTGLHFQRLYFQIRLRCWCSEFQHSFWGRHSPTRSGLNWIGKAIRASLCHHSFSINGKTLTLS